MDSRCAWSRRLQIRFVPFYPEAKTNIMNMNSSMNRRKFLNSAAIGGAAIAVSTRSVSVLTNGKPSVAAVSSDIGKPALLGGDPVRAKSFSAWPVADDQDERALTDVLHSKKWYRGSGNKVDRFEQEYAALTGARHCVATANGTSALFASVGALDIGPGDEVILPPYTFVATLNVILLQYALPVFVDSDRETFQIDAKKIEAAITPRTAAVIPVHMGGSAADLDTILAVSRKHKIAVIEDACQAHLAEWREQKVGTWGDAGCFSFQASKNLNCGEGGAILTNNDELADRCYAFHNNSNARRSTRRNMTDSGSRAANLRLTEFQAGLVLSQMTRVEEQSRIREENAKYLTSLFKEIPGIHPAAIYEGCTQNAYHLYMFRYRREEFGNLERTKFLQALGAEGIPCSSGYSPLNRHAAVRATFRTKGYRRIYSKTELDEWEERNQCPENDLLCQEGVWFSQTMLLGNRTDMDQIAEAVRKIKKHASALNKV